MNLTYTLQHGRRWCSPGCGVACEPAPWLSAMLFSFPSFDSVLRRSSVCCRSSCEPERFSAMLFSLLCRLSARCLSLQISMRSKSQMSVPQAQQSLVILSQVPLVLLSPVPIVPSLVQGLPMLVLLSLAAPNQTLLLSGKTLPLSFPWRSGNRLAPSVLFSLATTTGHPAQGSELRPDSAGAVGLSSRPSQPHSPPSWT